MGKLIVNKIDLNDLTEVEKLKSAIQRLINRCSRYYPLKFKPPFYFETPDCSLPNKKGWYIILDGKIPIYVGKADNLNNRLNTDNGSVDNFANQNRGSDNERNFIKKFTELGIFNKLRVCIILEEDLCRELNLTQSNLTDLDRGNTEKFINIFKCYFTYK